MDEQEASERSRRLLANVERASELLDDAGDYHWGSWMETVHRELMAHDAHGLDRLLGAFGGMGSFNDLVIDPANSHTPTEADVHALNDELDRLRSELYDDARALRAFNHRAR